MRDTFDPTTTKHLADILADAARTTPEHLADLIDEAQWHGSHDDAEDHAVGHYIAGQILAATGRRVTVWVHHHDVLVLDLFDRTALARDTLTGGAAELADLIGERADGFEHLHDTTAAEIAHERADGVAADDDPHFFVAITALYESIAA